MTMFSFRVADEEAAEADRWAEQLDLGRSELLRQALRHHVARLRADEDSERWLAAPLDDDEQAIGAIAEWGLAEDWSDWADAAR